VKGNKELTFIMILPLQMFDSTDQNQMSPVFVVKSRLKIDYWFILCFGLLPLVLKKINNSSKLFYTLGLLRNSAIDEHNLL
jgi:hypothetical protein